MYEKCDGIRILHNKNHCPQQICYIYFEDMLSQHIFYSHLRKKFQS